MARQHLRAIVACSVLLGLLMIAAGRGTNVPASGRVDPSLAIGVKTPVPAPVADVLRRSCFDCHSEETRWPWYAQLPPGSWIVGRDVVAGRKQLNFSRWTEYNPYDRADLLDKMCDLTTKHRMPLWQYRLVHRDARLADADVKALCAWADAEATRLVNGGS